MRQQRESQDGDNYSQVINTKIGIILTNTESSLGEGFRLVESGAIGKFSPGAALGEAIFDVIGDLIDKSTESRGGDRRLRLGGGDGGGSRLSG